MTRRDPDRTRREILEAAFREIYRNGFQATGLEAILEGTGVTKGALYHHFRNKTELGYAVVDEVVRPWMLDRWEARFAETSDPVTALKTVMSLILDEMPDEMILLGCPLNNLAQELSGVDEGFRARIEGIMDDWRESIAEALRRGQVEGTVRDDVDAEATALFLIASWEGMAGVAKSLRDRERARAILDVLAELIEGLRPTRPTVAATP
jgi:TetR/AcrR family transcriptional repressor of nem operon